MLSRYGGNLESFNELPLEIGIKLIDKCYYEKTKREYFEVWVSMYPHMDKEHFIPFKDFFKEEIPDREKTDEKLARKKMTVEDALKLQKEVMSKIQNGNFKEVRM